MSGGGGGGGELKALKVYLINVLLLNSPKSKFEPPYCFLHFRNCVNLLYIFFMRSFQVYACLFFVSRTVLFNHCESREEGTRNVVAECLGKLTLIDPNRLLGQLQVCSIEALCVCLMGFSVYKTYQLLFNRDLCQRDLDIYPHLNMAVLVYIYVNLWLELDNCLSVAQLVIECCT